MRAVTFNNKSNTIAAHLYLPADFDEKKSYAAVVLATPGSSVKEQIGSTYAKKLSENGFVALTYDPSFQGESSGEPRDLEDPATRVEDISCALDYLMTQQFIDEERIGLLGICAGGGYAVNAAVSDHRFKALGTVVAVNIGHAMRGRLSREAMIQTLEAVGKQRTAEARGETFRRESWIPESLKNAKEIGVTDPELLEAVEYYQESEHRHPRRTNKLLFRSLAQILKFDAFHLVPELLSQPVQIIVGSRQGNTGQYETGHKLFDLVSTKDKDLYVVEGAGHYEMYFKPDYVTRAVEVLVTFYLKHLN